MLGGGALWGEDEARFTHPPPAHTDPHTHAHTHTREGRERGLPEAGALRVEDEAGALRVEDEARFKVWFRTIRAPPPYAPPPACWRESEPLSR